MSNSVEETQLRKRISENVARIMAERKINDTELSKKAKASVNRIINGKSTPSIYTALRIANALNISLDELCGNYKYFTYDRKRGLSAGDSLELLFTLADLFHSQLNVNSLEIPESNVRDALIDYHKYYIKYKFAKELKPSSFKLEPEEARTKYMTGRIEELRNKQIELYNSSKKKSDNFNNLIDDTMQSEPPDYSEEYISSLFASDDVDEK